MIYFYNYYLLSLLSILLPNIVLFLTTVYSHYECSRFIIKPVILYDYLKNCEHDYQQCHFKKLKCKIWVES